MKEERGDLSGTGDEVLAQEMGTRRAERGQNVGGERRLLMDQGQWVMELRFQTVGSPGCGCKRACRG